LGLAQNVTSTTRDKTLNIGYWTVNCEAWYQRHLAEIKGGKAELYDSTQWKQKLRYRPPITRTFRENTNKLANTVLDERYHYWKA
jgi:hypothetical protein